MQGAEPLLWERMARLYNACPKDSTTDLCEAAMTVRTISPGQPTAIQEGTRTAPFGTVPTSSRGKAGQGR